ncbi:hypothetical protein D5R81_01380 [Parashewanella spongiae]|uniref:ImpA N-terminal domain-containing protein n=1 Tax=Parashewanella spongiae TaxID=342950 RepID=A0A3A6TSV7_9GAMM|nr:type VI secretion system ImpA family N-terminal domain-containing protein [Parashewanella spongiae]MCL1076801.1 type VI secretion system ImpA family N-terminal domain-containing protein [Parashewanella spongiae]RJY19275.1 hypothetical protein D5R81_01380 [Parashewanella spongiae]
MLTDEDIEKMHTVISEEYPCGVSINSDRTEYRKLRNLYNVCQTSLRMMTEVNEDEDLDTYSVKNVENWTQLSEDLINVFSTRSKDIELIGWFIIAQIIIDNSFDSLENTFKWLYKLVDENWDNLPPLVSKDKLDTESEEDAKKEVTKCKTNALSPILGDSLESTILFPPILIHEINSEIKVFDYISAEKKSTLESLKESAAQQLIDKDYELNKVSNLSTIIGLLENLSEKINEKTIRCNVSHCNFTFLINLFNKVKQSITFITDVELNETVDAESSLEDIRDDELTSNEDLETGSKQPSGSNIIKESKINSMDKSYLENAYKSNQNRNVALQNLKEISEFFYITEPHSPVSFLLNKTIRWANSPLSTLLDELIGGFDKDLLNDIYRATGIEGQVQTKIMRKQRNDEKVQVSEVGDIEENTKHVSINGSNDKGTVEIKKTESSKNGDDSLKVKPVKW